MTSPNEDSLYAHEPNANPTYIYIMFNTRIIQGSILKSENRVYCNNAYIKYRVKQQLMIINNNK